MKISVTAILLAAILLTACQSGTKSDTVKSEWPQQMQQLKTRFMDAMVLAFDSKRFYDESESKKNLQIIKDFSATAHNIDAGKAKEVMGNDPMVTYTINNLNGQIAIAQKSFTEGHKSYSQTLLRHSVSACVQCHTRTKMGPQFYDSQALNLLKVDPLSKADILTATRNLAEARTTLSDFLLDPKNTEMNAFYRDKAVKKYLAITLRFDENPKQAEDFLNDLSKVKGLNSSEQQRFSTWTKALQKWNREANKKTFSGLRFRESDPQSLFSNSMDATDGNYIENLRQATQLHKELQSTTTDRSKVYLELGNIYDQMGEATYWEIPEVYFEACIRQKPNSLTAKSCFYRYQSRMVFGYTGSSGTYIPQEEIKRLQDLKKVAGIVK